MSRPGVTYFLDGAHTTDSIVNAFNWYRKSVEAERSTGGERRYKTALLFNKTGNQSAVLGHRLHKSLDGLDLHYVGNRLPLLS